MDKTSAKMRQSTFFWEILGIVFLVMLALNTLTPYLADDFTFSYSFADRDTLHSPYILFRSAYYHYNDWSGRIIVKFFAQLFTIPPKWVFNFVNAAIFCAFSLVIVKLGTGKHGTHSYDPLLLGGVLISLWLVSPVFGQTNLWMCGSCNNLWSSFGCLAFLLPCAFYLERPFETKDWMPPLAFLGGLICGWLYENTSAAMLVCLVLFLFWLLFNKQKIPAWLICGLVGGILGYAMLILAPGNSVRTDDSAPAAGLLDYIVRTEKAALILIRYGWPLLLAFVILFALLLKQRVSLSSLVWPIILFLGGMAANFAMIGSPVYYLRSTHGVFSLLTAACAACFARLESPPIRKFIKATLACGVGYSLVVLLFAGYDIAKYDTLYQARDSEIRAAVSAGQTHIQTYSIFPNTRFCGAFGLPDIRQNEDWISITRCMWYGLDGLGLKTGEQATITADDSAPLTYPPLWGLNIGRGVSD